ncbi:hypothetical protein [Silvimonas sp.]|uniref:hypothetical protein n=1 Tax=Silvimonas sp. TaxID=2650811 RepID=UPI00284B0171|nr:hypothetical protein [Silvimonas sp.]MDR3427858.1 hypothetical protein [Silvimonas sp.]
MEKQTPQAVTDALETVAEAKARLAKEPESEAARQNLKWAQAALDAVSTVDHN